MEAVAQPQLTPAQREWLRCRHWIEDAIAKGPRLETIEDVEMGSAEYRLIFWAGEDFAAISRIDEYPNAKVMMITHAGGNMERMLHGGLDDVLYFAAGLGCDTIGIECQRQHVPTLRDSGFSEAFTTMLRPLPKPVTIMSDQMANDSSTNAEKTISEASALGQTSPEPGAA